MSHLELRLKERYGITGVSSKYIKFLVMTQGEKVTTTNQSTIYKIRVKGLDVYALLSVGNKDPKTQVVTTVYKPEDVERIKSMGVVCE